MKTVRLDPEFRASEPDARHGNSWEYVIFQIGRGGGTWQTVDPQSRLDLFITLELVSHLGDMDAVWRVAIHGPASQIVSRIILVDSCDTGDDSNPSAAHNGRLPVTVYPSPDTFAASWNAFVAFRIHTV